MTSKQKLKRIAELIAVGRAKIDSNAWREICSLSGNHAHLPPAKVFKQVAPSPDLERAKKIRASVAEYFGMREAMMWGNTRTETVAWARHVAMALIARELPALADETIGNLFCRDHGIVRHAKNRINEMLSPTFVPNDTKAEARLAGLAKINI
jgi:hypothetical protein